MKADDIGWLDAGYELGFEQSEAIGDENVFRQTPLPDFDRESRGVDSRCGRKNDGRTGHNYVWQIRIGVLNDVVGKLFPLEVVENESKQAVLMDRGACSAISGDRCAIKQPKILSRLIHKGHRKRGHDDVNSNC